MRCVAVLLLVAVAGVLRAQTLSDDLRRAAEPRPAVTGAPREFERLAAAAGEAFRAGDADVAIQRFDEAAAEAFRVGASGSAFEYGLAAAELTRQAGDQARAASRFRRAALAAVRDPRAAATHAAACNAFAAALRAVASATPEQLDDYESLLVEHVTTWPDSPTESTVRRRWVELLATRGDHAGVLDATQPTDAWSLPLRIAAFDGLRRSAASPAEHATALARLTPELQTLILGESNTWPERWSADQRSAALVLARGHLARDPDGPEYARRVLSVALRTAPQSESESEPAWRAEARTILVAAELLCERPDRATALIAGAADADARSAFAARLRAAQPLRRSGEAERFGRAIGWLAPSGEPATVEGVDRDFAAAERGGGDPPTAGAALDAWTQLERRSARGSQRWREARLGRIATLTELGRGDDAAKLLRLTRLLAPSADPAWLESLDQLGAELAVP